jgi:hypothetical protein
MNELNDKSIETVINRAQANAADAVLDLIEDALRRARHWSKRTLRNPPRTEPLHTMTEAQEVAARKAVAELAATLTKVLDLEKAGDSQALELLGDCAPPAEIDLRVIAVNAAFGAAGLGEPFNT